MILNDEKSKVMHWFYDGKKVPVLFVTVLLHSIELSIDFQIELPSVIICAIIL